MIILGVNAYHGDSSAALLVDGTLAAALEEERYNRIKHWAGLPVLAARACLSHADCRKVDHVAISRDPRAHFLSKLLRVSVRPSYWTKAARRAGNSLRVAQVKADLADAGLPVNDAQMHFVEHHRAHLASAFFVSPFEEAAIVSVDGFGDFSSVMWAVGTGHNMAVRGHVRFPHSLGLFYTAFTQFLGFPKYGDEYKMMGLSAYGEARLVNKVRDVVHTAQDQVRLNLDYFTHHQDGVEMSWDNGEPALGPVFSAKMLEIFGEPRVPGSEFTQYHMDLAASVQKELENNYFALLNHVHKETGLKAVCLAGGVALNCVANGMIFERTPFTDVYVQPAAHDAGTSFGAALYVQHHKLQQQRSYRMRDVYHGPQYGRDLIRPAMEAAGVHFHELFEDELLTRTAQEIAAGKVAGWYQGRMEFGPRALGNRSILADPRRKDMKDILNSRIKHREPFRPFCPSIMAERVQDFFEIGYPSPFMVMAYKIKMEQRERIPAVTHGDGTGRLQTVEQDVNPLYWGLLKKFDQIAGVPVLLNTSFNENEPIVNTPAEAIDCFLRTRMDVLAIGPYLILKAENESVSAGREAFVATR